MVPAFSGGSLLSRILIISTNRELAPQPTVPIGAAWVAEALHLAGFTVELLDLCFRKDPLQAVADALTTFKPDGIGLSVRNLDNCDFLSPKSFLPELKTITDFLKSRTGVPILLGGAGVSIMPLQMLRYLELDYAVVGEGERAAVAFFEGRGGADGDFALPGVVRRGAVAVEETLPERLLPGASVMPRIDRWVDTRRYLGYEPVLPVQGKRGCANRCLYCTYNRIEGVGWRMREAGSVAEEIAMTMRSTGAREFEFVDSVFNQPEGYLETLLEEILRRGVRAKFSVSSLSPRGLTKAQLDLMERVGMTSLVITPETASDVTLAALGKDFGEEELHRAAELIAGSGIRALWCFLLGGPRESRSTLAKTVSFLNSCTGKKDGAFITTGIRIYPGTGLHRLALRERMVEQDDDLLMPRFYFSPELTPQDAGNMLQNGVADLTRCIFLSDTRLGSFAPLRRLGAMIGLPTPFWRYAGYLNRIKGSNRAISGKPKKSI